MEIMGSLSHLREWWGMERSLITKLLNIASKANNGYKRIKKPQEVVGWVERQKNGGFRCFNLVLHTFHNMQAMCN